MIEYILIALLLFFSFSVLLPLILSISYTFSKDQKEISSKEHSKIAVLIPAYREDAVIEETVRKTLLQNYPKHKFEVIVIADQLSKDVINSISKLDARVIEVAFSKSTKVKALNAAFDRISTSDFELALIVDADNHLDEEFLNIINAKYQNGSIAMQGRREAKNYNEATAFLDGISELANTNIYGEGANNLGLSARLAGSGMAFRYKLLKRLMNEATAIGGFDKELELKLTKEKIKIDFLSTAVVYDEKVNNPEVFSHQRSRWLQAQYHFLLLYWFSGIKELLARGNFDHFYKVIVLALPPKLLVPGILLALSLTSYLLVDETIVCVAFLILLVFFVLTYIMAIPKTYFKSANFRNWLGLFTMVHQTIKALLKMGKAKKEFIHTPHKT